MMQTGCEVGRTRWQSECIEGTMSTRRMYEGKGREELLNNEVMPLLMEMEKRVNSGDEEV